METPHLKNGGLPFFYFVGPVEFPRGFDKGAQLEVAKCFLSRSVEEVDSIVMLCSALDDSFCLR